MPLFQPTSLSVTAISFTGVIAAGPAALPGAAVGMTVISVFQTSFTAPGVLIPLAAGDFESTISVINQIQQLAATDLTTSNFTALLQ